MKKEPHGCAALFSQSTLRLAEGDVSDCETQSPPCYRFTTFLIPIKRCPLLTLIKYTPVV